MYFQILLGRKYIVENCGYPDIFSKSPLQALLHLPWFISLFDQCSCGPSINGEHVRKRCHFQGSHVFQHLVHLCQGGHSHLQLRGGGLAASAALYPDKECALIMLEAKLPTDACKGGRNLLCDNTSVDAFAMKPWSEQLVILQAIAKIKGFTNVWNSVVQPWLQGKSSGVGS